MPLPVYEVPAIRVNTIKSTCTFSSVCIVYVSANTLSINWKFYTNKKIHIFTEGGGRCRLAKTYVYKNVVLVEMNATVSML